MNTLMRNTYYTIKHNGFRLLFFPLLLSLNVSYAQMMGSNVFLQGNYLEIGIQYNGALGADNIPAGYHPRNSSGGGGLWLAEVYDEGHDGWETGTPPYMGDYTYPDSPYEGWALQVDGIRSQAYQFTAGGFTGPLGLTGTNTGYASAADRVSGHWAGVTTDGLQVDMETEVKTNASCVVMNVKLRNTSAITMPDVYYLRTCDPDVDRTNGGSPINKLTIVYQNDTANRVMVRGEGLVWPASISLGAKDARAKALWYTAWPVNISIDLATYYDGTAVGVVTTLDSISTSDRAIGLIFSLGTIAPGDSVTFSYAYIFDGNIDDAFAPDCPGLSLSGTTIITHPHCVGDLTGSYEITSTGSDSIMYSLDSAAFTPFRLSDTNSLVLSGLAIGTHELIILDAITGCGEPTGPRTFSIDAPVPITQAVLSLTMPTCSYGVSNGYFQIAGGTPRYTITTAGYTSSPSLGAWNVTLPAGTWPYTVTDTFGCTFNDTFVITAPPPIALAATQSNVSCFGGANGSISFSATGGTPPYTYAKGAGAYAGSASFTGLSAGEYTFHVKDNANCVHDTTITITEQSRITPGAVSTNNTCFGAANASVSLSASGGVPPYTYARGTGTYSASAFFTGLFAGANVFHIKDANNCIRDTTISTTQPGAVNGTTSVTPLTCFGGSTGSFTVTASGGTPPYTYALGTDAYGTSSVFSGLTAGAYVLHIKDNNNCLKDVNVTLTQPTIITPVKTIANVLCFGGNTGIATIAASGGTPPYSYSWGTGPFLPLISSAVMNNLTAGIYPFTIQDSKGCMRTDNATVTEPTQLNLSHTPTNVSCYGGSNGTVLLTGSGGTPPYTFARGLGLYSSSPLYGGLVAGTYTFHIRDSKYCTQTISVSITQPERIVPSASVTDVLCHAALTGTISLGASGGTPPFSYARGTGVYTSSPTFSGLAAGVNVMHIKDANNCVKDTTVTITQPTALQSALTLAHIYCFGEAGGAISVAASGGVSPYEYSIDGGPYVSSNVFLALYAGIHQVYARDANNCIKNVAATITQPARLQSTLSVRDVACNGGNSGRVIITTTGGVPPYTYAMGTGTYASTGTFNSLTAGTYTFHIKDLANCQRDTVITITEPAKVVPAASVTDARCHASATGTVTLGAAGGVPPYLYAVGTGGYAASATFSGLTAQTYTFHVRDVKGCISDTILAVSQPSRIAAAATVTNVGCTGRSDGSVTISAAGGTPPYTYAKGTSTFGTSPVFPNLAAQTATYRIKDANDCLKDTLITITQPTKLKATVSGTPTSCYYKNDGSVACVASGGTAPYRYQWTTGDTIASLAGIAKGRYFVVVQDANQCQLSRSIFVTGPDTIRISATVKHPLCDGDCDGSIITRATGGRPPRAALWSNGSILPSISQQCAGVYSVTYTDAAGCTASSAYELAGPPPLDLNIGPDIRLCKTQTIKLNAPIGKPAATYAWGSSGGLKSADSAIVVSAAAQYWVKVTDSIGCFATDTINISKSTADVNPDFVVSSRVFKDSVVTLVNITSPLPDSMVWLAPTSSLVTIKSTSDMYRELVFADTGAFVVGLTAYNDGCSRTLTDTLVSVIGTIFNDPGIVAGPYIDTFTVAPNPSQGDFTVNIKLAQESGIRLRIISFNKYAVISDERRSGSDRYTIPYSVITIPGVYILMLETPLEHREIKLIIQ